MSEMNEAFVLKGNVLAKYQGPGRDVAVPEGVTVIGVAGFYSCSSLVHIELPRTVEKLGFSVFAHCTALEHITIPELVVCIPRQAFQGCTSLTDITLPAGLEEICEEAFTSCTALREITIPAGVAKLEAETFLGCTRLERVTILGRDTKISASALRGTTAEVVGLPLGKLPQEVREHTLRAFARQYAAGASIPEAHRALCVKYIKRRGKMLLPLAQTEPDLLAVLRELDIEE